MQTNHKEKLDRKKIRIIHWISFFIGFTQSVLIYVMSSYFKEISGQENLGGFYFVSYFFILVILLNLHKLMSSFGKSAVFCLLVLASIILSFGLILLPNSWWGIALMMAYIIASMLAWVSTDVILESFSTDAMSGRIRGVHLTFLNMGFLFGPFVSTRILEKFDFNGIFAFLVISNSLILITALLKLRSVSYKCLKKESILGLVKNVMKRKNVVRIYYIAFILEFFFSLLVIYTPIYLLNNGMTWNQIGIIFTYMLIPFVIFQIPVGFLADKKMGEKELLILALAFMGISTFALYFISSFTVFVWAVALFATRVGAALVEILRDSYFYKRIDAGDVDTINFFRTALPMGNMAAAILSFVLLINLPLQFIFILVSLIVFTALYPALKLQDSRSEAEIKG